MRSEGERQLNRGVAGREQGRAGTGPSSEAGNPDGRTGNLSPWLLALLPATLLIAWPWLSGRVTVPWDAKAQFLPQLQFLAHSLADGDSPFWTPYVFAGHPQIADAQSLIFSPPFLLLAWLVPEPSAWAMDATVTAFLVASAAALMAWLTGKDVHPFAAFSAALAFAFGAAMAWRIQHTGQVLSLGYLPFVLLFLDRALERRSVLNGIAAGIAAGVLVLGRDQVALLAVYFLIGYAAWFWFDGENRIARINGTLLPLIGGGVAGLAVIAIPVLLTLLLAGDSNRPSIDLEGAGRGSLHPALFLTAFAPDVFGSSGVMGEYWGPPSMRWSGTGLYIAQNMGQFYMGALPLLALLWGAMTGVLWERRARVFTIALLFCIVYALGWYTPVFQILHAYMPGVDLYRRPADAVFLIGFLASVLSAFALDKLLRDESALRAPDALMMIALLAAAFAAMITLAIHFDKLAPAWPHIAIPALLFVVAGALLSAASQTRGYLRKLLLGAGAVFMAGDLAYSNGPGGATGLPPELYEALEPDTANETMNLLKRLTLAGQSETRRDRVELVGLGFHWPNASLTHKLEATLGYNPVRLGLTTRALGAGDTVGLPDQKGFSPLFPSYRSPLADLLGLRYIATGVAIETIDKSLAPGDLTLIARTEDGYIYENPRALPRVLFASAAQDANFEDLLATGRWPDIDVTKTVLIEGIGQFKPREPGTARIASYRNTEIVIEADSPGGGFIVLNDVWHPWWTAQIDGQAAKIHRANVLFRAVEVPAGKHTLTFRFEPVAGAMKQLRAARGQ